MRTTVVPVEEPGADFTFAEVELDEPRPDEVLRIVATGPPHRPDRAHPVARRDDADRHGPRGHRRRRAGRRDVVGIEVGDHVVLSFRSCRTCGPCQAGDVVLLRAVAAAQLHGHARRRFHHHEAAPGERESQTVFGSFRPVQPRPPRFSRTPTTAWSSTRGSTSPGSPPRLRLPDRRRHRPHRARPCTRRAAGGLRCRGGRPARRRRRPGARRRDRRGRRPGRRASRRRRGYGATTLDPTDETDGPVPDRARQLTGGGAAYAIDTTAIAAVVPQAQPLRLTGPAGGARARRGGVHHRRDRPAAVGKIVRASIEGEADPLRTIPPS